VKEIEIQRERVTRKKKEGIGNSELNEEECIKKEPKD